VLLTLALPARAQLPWESGGQRPSQDQLARWQPPPPPPNYGEGRVPNIDGIWYNHSNGGRCRVMQRWPDTRALFTNENGDQAWGSIDGNRVFIPDWNNGQGQRGRIRGDRIVWPDGNYWER
jgi:hypothetical protein